MKRWTPWVVVAVALAGLAGPTESGASGEELDGNQCHDRRSCVSVVSAQRDGMDCQGVPDGEVVALSITNNRSDDVMMNVGMPYDTKGTYGYETIYVKPQQAKRKVGCYGKRYCWEAFQKGDSFSCTTKCR
jgi:hypothetical protein